MLELEKGFESVNKTFRIPVNIVEQLDRLAGEYNTSMNKIVVQCLQYALDNLNTSDENPRTQNEPRLPFPDGGFFFFKTAQNRNEKAPR